MATTALAVLAPAATALAAAVALVVGVATVRQRGRADRRDAWWERARWALELAVGDGGADRRAVGIAVLEHLARSDLAGADEAAMLEAVWEPLLDSQVLHDDDEDVEYVVVDEEDARGGGPGDR